MHCVDVFISVTLTCKISAAFLRVITLDGDVIVIKACVPLHVMRNHPLVTVEALFGIFFRLMLLLDVTLTVCFAFEE
jgi:hypothetical protein